ncbi:MAG: HU family DNA-binding protein, partial [Acidobacteriota bacterium]
TIFDSIIEALRKEEKIELRGFGSFRIRNRHSRVGRNPKTGARVEVPAKKIPYFKPGKELKELINTDNNTALLAIDPIPPSAGHEPGSI